MTALAAPAAGRRHLPAAGGADRAIRVFTAAVVLAVFEGAQAFGSQRVWPVLGHLVLALIDLAAGLVAVVWPAPTALVLTLIVGIWAIAAGVFGIIAAFLRGESAGTRAMFIVTGLLSIAFGAIVVDRPVTGALTIALLFGLFSIVSGVATSIVIDSGSVTTTTRPGFFMAASTRGRLATC